MPRPIIWFTLLACTGRARRVQLSNVPLEVMPSVGCLTDTCQMARSVEFRFKRANALAMLLLTSYPVAAFSITCCRVPQSTLGRGTQTFESLCGMILNGKNPCSRYASHLRMSLAADGFTLPRFDSYATTINLKRVSRIICGLAIANLGLQLLQPCSLQPACSFAMSRWLFLRLLVL